VAELELIAAIERRLRARGDRVLRGPGDDAAVVRGGGIAVTSIDTVADGVHFRLSTHSPSDVGHKALGQALSDLAAMGARPGEAYVSLALPSGFGDAEALELVDGLEALAERSGVTVAGGDVVGAGALVVSVTVTGWAEDPAALAYRDGARPGDLVGVSGELGAAGAGLLLLDGLDCALDAGVREELVRRHLRPEPRLELGRALAGAGVSAMIDLSDGVATDAEHLSACSGASLEVRLPDLPLADGVTEVARSARREPYELAAASGDDYELLFTVSPDRREAVEEAASSAGAVLGWIGSVVAGDAAVLLDASGTALALGGFEHR
jgi:thiamine-monophosphate kinase